MTSLQIAFAALWGVTCGYALLRGGAVERIVSGALVIAAVATVSAESALPRIYQSVEIGIVLVDGTLLAALVAVALVSAHYWPMVMASLHAASILGHVAEAIAPGILPAAYFLVVMCWSVPMQLLLAVATWRHRKRLQRYGVDYAWAAQLPPSYRLGVPFDGGLSS